MKNNKSNDNEKYVITEAELSSNEMFEIQECGPATVIIFNSNNVAATAVYNDYKNDKNSMTHSLIISWVKKYLKEKENVSEEPVISEIETVKSLDVSVKEQHEKATTFSERVKKQDRVASEESGETLISGDGWFALAKWAKENELFEGWERKMLFGFGRRVSQDKTLTVKQLPYAVKFLGEALEKGFNEAEEIKNK